MSARLDAQFAFLMEADRLKGVVRTNELIDRSRPENSAEHSWHLALYALAMPLAAGVDRDRVVAMLLVHDLVEIDVGDHPINGDHDAGALAAAEAAAARRLFSVLPADIGATLLALWHEFDAGHSAEAQAARQLDHSQPILQILAADPRRPDHHAIALDNLRRGRAARLAREWPALHAHALARAENRAHRDEPDLAARLAFLAEADRLKGVLRATTLADGSRRENSGEHSWHLALYALVLADHAAPGVAIDRVVKMLILHDLVEIDVGDVPIHSQNGTAHGSAAVAIAEARAADRIFGILPSAIGAPLRALWEEFEAAESPDAVFAKALDRVQPVLQNIAAGGGTWTEYNVTFAELETRVGQKVARGAPQLWDYVGNRARAFFDG
ncbi:MAG: HD domain-containing protein [Paracoccaceae bacterium]